MLTTDLSLASGLEVIATERLHDLLASAGRDPTAPLDRSTTSELARWAGADLVISGSVFASGGRYRIDAQAYDTATGTVVAAQKAEGTEPFSLVNELTAGLLGALEVGVSGDATASSSPEALAAFALGRGLYDRLAFAEAAEAFATAIDADEEFGSARLQLALSLLAQRDVEHARPVLLATVERPDRLPEPDRLLAQALAAYYVDGQASRGDELFQSLVERFPGRAEARLWWARATAEVEGKRLRAAGRLREALEVDPTSLHALVSLAEHLSDVGQDAEARRLLTEALERHPRARDAIESALGR
jgi:tetratricopeptide (TPR) repeat protein